MKDIKIPPNGSIDKVEKLCSTKISPRTYYLHNMMGGPGWRIYKSNQELILRIDDDEMATIIKLLL